METEFEEERAWPGFYMCVGLDLAIVAEVIAEFESDSEIKRAHLALYRCCNQPPLS